jgi:predicted Rossmann-fold nucleotide-binding protein
MKRVLVCGGRDYARIVPGKTFEYPRRIAEKKKASEALGKLVVEFGAFQLIHGGAKGADAAADAWAREQRGFPNPIVFEALWDDAAGPIRNEKMLREGKPDLVVAFPGGDGTKDMVDRARAAGVTVMEIR